MLFNRILTLESINSFIGKSKWNNLMWSNCMIKSGSVPHKFRHIGAKKWAMVVVILSVHSFLPPSVGKDFYCSLHSTKYEYQKYSIKDSNSKSIYKTSSTWFFKHEWNPNIFLIKSFTYGLTFYTVTLVCLLTFFACLAKVPNHDYGNRQFQNNKTCTFMPLLIGTVYRLGQ